MERIFNVQCNLKISIRVPSICQNGLNVARLDVSYFISDVWRRKLIENISNAAAERNFKREQRSLTSIFIDLSNISSNLRYFLGQKLIDFQIIRQILKKFSLECVRLQLNIEQPTNFTHMVYFSIIVMTSQVNTH